LETFAFLITDGKPSDTMLYSEMIPKIKALNFGVIVGCAVGIWLMIQS
jgi:uncharacterized protein YegL